MKKTPHTQNFISIINYNTDTRTHKHTDCIMRLSFVIQLLRIKTVAKNILSIATEFLRAYREEKKNFKWKYDESNSEKKSTFTGNETKKKRRRIWFLLAMPMFTKKTRSFLWPVTFHSCWKKTKEKEKKTAPKRVFHLTYFALHYLQPKPKPKHFRSSLKLQASILSASQEVWIH